VRIFLNKKLIVIAGFLIIFLRINLCSGEDSSLCYDCHDNMPATLENSPHQMSAKSSAGSVIEVGCMDCHDGWQAHLDDPSSENITRGPELALAKQAEICSRCHLTPHQMGLVSTDPHRRAELNCSACHTMHDNANEHLVKDSLDNFCLHCHTTAAFEFNRRSNHPLKTGNIKCIDCHNFSSMSDPNLAIGFDWICQSCHDDKAGPYLYEHPVTYSHLVEGGGCTECHEPHGSANDRLLKQPGKGLCLQCHSIPPGHQLNHDGLGMKLDCVVCHTDIHGSFDNKIFLDPDLGMKLFPDCYQSGCHIIGD
jgi:DmsE family decaheme c-type cytochrome